MHLPVGKAWLPRLTDWRQLLPGPVLLTGTLLYGFQVLSEAPRRDGKSVVRIGVIQGSIDTRLSAKAEVQKEKFEQYSRLTWSARNQWPELDFILWPENGLPAGVYDIISEQKSGEARDLADSKAEELRECSRIATGVPFELSEPISMIVGGLSIDDDDQYFNAALHLDTEGRVINRYSKMHRVMYGEYFPILNMIPGVKEQLPEIARGLEPVAFRVNDLKFVPLICFETTVPHLARSHLAQLEQDSEPVAAILNLTNDGWFFGTSCLDFHLACNVFRAVELRIPNIVCANTGFSAEIDRNGRLLQVGPRRDTLVFQATVTQPSGTSPYRRIGDWIPFLMAWTTLIGLGQVLLTQRR